GGRGEGGGPPPLDRGVCGLAGYRRGWGVREAAAVRDERNIGDGHYPSVRIALRAPEGVELLQVHVAEAGLRRELPAGGLIERFLHPHPAAGQCPSSPERAVLHLDEEEVERARDDGEHGDVDRHGRRLPPGATHPRSAAELEHALEGHRRALPHVLRDRDLRPERDECVAGALERDHLHVVAELAALVELLLGYLDEEPIAEPALRHDQELALLALLRV